MWLVSLYADNGIYLEWWCGPNVSKLTMGYTLSGDVDQMSLSWQWDIPWVVMWTKCDWSVSMPTMGYTLSGDVDQMFQSLCWQWEIPWVVMWIKCDWSVSMLTMGYTLSGDVDQMWLVSIYVDNGIYLEWWCGPNVSVYMPTGAHFPNTYGLTTYTKVINGLPENGFIPSIH